LTVASRVVFELAVGQGLGLPTLVLFLISADEDLPLSPGDLRGLDQVRWEPSTEPTTLRGCVSWCLSSRRLARRARGGYGFRI
jgi:hypothetical protein